MKYRKKPVVIEAVTVQSILDRKHGSPWISDAILSGIVRVYEEVVVVRTLEGNMTGKIGDWILKGVKGELYPCAGDIFEATYEPADE